MPDEKPQRRPGRKPIEDRHTDIQKSIIARLKAIAMSPYELGRRCGWCRHAIYRMLARTTSVQNIQRMFDVLSLRVTDDPPDKRKDKR